MDKTTRTGLWICGDGRIRDYKYKYLPNTGVLRIVWTYDEDSFELITEKDVPSLTSFAEYRTRYSKPLKSKKLTCYNITMFDTATRLDEVREVFSRGSTEKERADHGVESQEAYRRYYAQKYLEEHPEMRGREYERPAQQQADNKAQDLLSGQKLDRSRKTSNFTCGKEGKVLVKDLYHSKPQKLLADVRTDTQEEPVTNQFDHGCQGNKKSGGSASLTFKRVPIKYNDTYLMLLGYASSFVDGWSVYIGSLFELLVCAVSELWSGFKHDTEVLLGKIFGNSGASDERSKPFLSDLARQNRKRK